MLALVERDDAHVGVDVDADEYICGMDGKARERERVFCVVQQRETIKNIIHFYRHFLWIYFFEEEKRCIQKK